MRLFTALRPMAVLAAATLTLSSAADAQLRYNVNDATCPKTWLYGPNKTLQFRMEYTGGKRALIADGGVDDVAASRLDAAIRQFQPIDEIWLRSPGGNSAQGRELGRVIRRWGIPTRVPAGWGCASACTMAFLGGPIRTIEPGAVYSVHMFSRVGNDQYQKAIELERARGNAYLLEELQRREQGGALTATEENDYIIKMGVSRKLLAEVIYPQLQNNFSRQQGSTIYCMNDEELRRYNVVNN